MSEKRRFYIGVDPDLRNLTYSIFTSGADRGSPLKFHSVGHIEIARDLSQEAAILAAPVYLITRLRALKVVAADEINVAVEGQKIDKRTPHPQSILALGQQAGALAGALIEWTHNSQGRVLLPVPEAWKGQVPKRIHHERLCNRLGWEFKVIGSQRDPVTVPDLEGYGIIRDSAWKHAMDSTGLALWCYDECMKKMPLRSSTRA